MTKRKNKVCWTITDNFPGMKSQVIGLAEAVGLQTFHKTCKRRWPWSWFNFLGGNPLSQLTSESDSLAPPWPDLIISCGRRSAPLSLAIKEQNQGKTLCVHIQDPLYQRKNFDLIVAPEHDRLTGPNVVSSKGALHKITKEKLKEGIKAHGDLFKNLPRPYSVVLIGGSTNRYNMSRKALEKLVDRIFLIRKITQGSVLVTPSFRTPFRKVLSQSLENKPDIFLADIETLNPYFAMLGLADFIFVTDDSVNMLCEACMTGKPVYALPLLNHGDTKPKKFINQLIKEGIVQRFEGSIKRWTYTPFNDTAKIAAIVQEMIKPEKG